MLTAQSVRHEPLDEGEKGDKRLRRIGKNQSRGDDIDILHRRLCYVFERRRFAQC